MRRLTSMFLAVVLSAGIAPSIAAGGSSSGSRTLDWRGILRLFGGGMAVAEVVKQIRAGLARVRDEIPARRARLHPLRCGSHECYSAEEVSAAIAAIRRDVKAVFPKAALASQISLDEEIAQVSALGGAGSEGSIQLVRNPPEAAPSTYDRRTVDRAFEGTREQIDRYVAHDVLNPTIHVSSEPKGADFVLQIGENTRTRRDVRTDGNAQSVWRGHYVGHIHKPGYRDAEVRVDLMNENKTRIRCRLFRTEASEESACAMEE